MLAAALGASKLCLSGHLLINFTASIPRGVYWISTSQRPRRGDLVTFPIPESVRELVHVRRYVPASIQLLSKPVAAVSGDRVCVRDNRLFVNDEFAGNVLDVDPEGRSVPKDITCAMLRPGQLYVAAHHDNSFDSRCFGPIPVDGVRGTLTPLITF